MGQFKQVQFIINPASGGDEPILNLINDALKEHDIVWNVDVTLGAGDGAKFARQAIERGVDLIAAYGGDGTLLDVAEGVIGTETPIAFLPGGTANALVDELEIPANLRDAVSLIHRPAAKLRKIDAINLGERYCLLRAGTGAVGTMSNAVKREHKDRFGLFAYIVGVVNAIKQPDNNHYKLTIDGETVEMEGIACLVTNGGAMGGTLNVRLGSSVQIDDGLLDVYLMKGDLLSYVDLARSLTQMDDDVMQSLKHWQAKSVHIEAEKPEGLYCDGEEEPFGETPITIEVAHHALNVLVPGETVAD